MSKAIIYTTLCVFIIAFYVISTIFFCIYFINSEIQSHKFIDDDDKIHKIKVRLLVCLCIYFALFFLHFLLLTSIYYLTGIVVNIQAWIKFYFSCFIGIAAFVNSTYKFNQRVLALERAVQIVVGFAGILFSIFSVVEGNRGFWLYLKNIENRRPSKVRHKRRILYI